MTENAIPSKRDILRASHWLERNLNRSLADVVKATAILLYEESFEDVRGGIRKILPMEIVPTIMKLAVIEIGKHLEANRQRAIKK